jgi:RNA polymerase sigma-70 factor (ECF subfamily)
MMANLLAEAGDEELVLQTKQGGRRAFEELVERYKKKAFRVAYDFTRNREEAKDLSQEAFLRAYTHIKGFDGQSTFATWFHRILINVCIDHHRRRKKAVHEPLEDTAEILTSVQGMSSPAPVPDRAVMARQVSMRIEAALAKLPINQRTAFILRTHHHMSIREVAQVMDAAEGTVKAHLHRAVTALRNLLADLRQGEPV